MNYGLTTKNTKPAKNKGLMLLCFGIGLLVTALIGCAGLKKIAFQPGAVEVLRAGQTNETIAIATNQVAVPATTNALTGEIIPAGTRVFVTTNVVQVVLPPLLFTNAAFSDAVRNGVNAGGDVLNLAGVPGGKAGATILSMAGAGVLGWWNQRQKRKLLDVNSALKDTTTALGTVVDNFESIRKAALTIPAYASIDHKVMDTVKNAQLIAGGPIKDLIGRIVDARTDDTIPNP